MSGEASYRPDLRLRLLGGRPFFGPGPAALLRAVARQGAVAPACESLGLSYSKGRGMLRVMEAELGYPVVRCERGGSGGGSASLTPKGARLLQQYTRYENEVRRYAKRRFAAMQAALNAEMPPGEAGAADTDNNTISEGETAP